LSAASLLSTLSPSAASEEELPDAAHELPLVPDEQVLVPQFESHVLASVEEEQVVLLLPFDVQEFVQFESAVGQEDVPNAKVGSVKHAAIINTVAVFVIFKSLQ